MAATWLMVGVIWIVQLVHYPMFAFLDQREFSRSHAFHSSAISFVVLPAMVVELVLAGLILMGKPNAASITGFALVLLIWAATFLIMIPIHNKLGAGGYQLDLIHSLVRWNWVRTVAWSVRGFIALFWL